MEKFVKRMIDEHRELAKRIVKLRNYIYSDKSNNDDKVEFANKCIQLAAMETYEEALRTRLENQGVICGVDEYFERVCKEPPVEEENDGKSE